MADTTVAKQRLTELLRQLDDSAAVLADTETRDTSELSTVDQHPADYATNLVDADREEASVEVVQAQRERVLAALARIEDGSYGKCLTCGEEIPEARLEAIPEAERDVEHQQEFEAAR